MEKVLKEKDLIDNNAKIVLDPELEIVKERRLKDLTTILNELKNIHLNDMATLNRVLSTYEDEINSLKQLVFDLSFKFKQLQSIVPPVEQ